MIDSWRISNSEQEIRRLDSHRIQSYMGSHGVFHSPSITCTLSRHYNANRFIAPTKATPGTDSINHQAPKPRRLPGRQSLSDVVVAGSTLKTRTHSHGIPGLGMLQSSYPSVESVLPMTREKLDMQEASGVRRTTRWASSYPLGLRWGVQNVGIHHHAVDMSRSITCSNVLVQTSSIVKVGT